jgi:deoxycytidine triphosphate deaminase
MLLSDQDIQKILNREIVIYPFDENDLTPVGYNLNPSDFVFSIQSQSLVLESNGFFEIQPHDTVLILTKEAVWVSRKIAGTFHSKVSVVSAGFGHISTTLDPNWKGPLLISLNNPTDNSLNIPVDKSFVTLVFYKVRTPALKDALDNLPSRADILTNISNKILANTITQNQRQLLSKVNSIVKNPNIYDEFENKCNELYQRSKAPILKGLKRHILFNRLNSLRYWSLLSFQIILITILLLKLVSTFIYPMSFMKMILNPIDKSTFVALVAVLITSFQINTRP